MAEDLDNEVCGWSIAIWLRLVMQSENRSKVNDLVAKMIDPSRGRRMLKCGRSTKVDIKIWLID